MPDDLKRIAADRAAEEVRDQMIVGLGTGSTAAFMIEALGRRVRDQQLHILAIPTSEATAQQASSVGIPLTTFALHPAIDLTIDGADEIESGTLNLIKGLGGALLREKIVASASRRLIIIADESKLVDHLGAHAPVPVEVVPFGWEATAAQLTKLGATVKLRTVSEREIPFETDSGHYILDCSFGVITDASAIAAKLDGTTGVVEHGLFLNLTSTVFVGTATGVRELHAPAPNRLRNPLPTGHGS